MSSESSPAGGLEKSISFALSSLAAVEVSASLLDSDFTGRLDTHTAAATVNTVALVSYMVATVQSCVPAFASNARRHLRTADKRLLLKAEELDGAKKAFLVLLQHATSGEDTDELLKELGDVIARSLDSLDGFSPTSTMLAFSCVETLEQISECSSIDIGIDVSRSSISHAPWLTRGERSNVVITVVDAVGEALPGLTAEDVCTSVDSDAVGWEVSSVSVWSNYVSLWITLAPDCSDTVSVTARIVDTRFLIPLKASVSSAKIAAAKAECQRHQGLDAPSTVPFHEMTSLVTACTTALSSPEVAISLCEFVTSVCWNSSAPVNGTTCGAAGVIPALLSCLSAHGTLNVAVVRKACEALGDLANCYAVNADAIVLSSGGLDVILSMMTLHASDKEVQWRACYALWRIANSASATALAAMRASAAIDALHAAKKRFRKPARYHPGGVDVSGTATQALLVLEPAEA